VLLSWAHFYEKFECAHRIDFGTNLGGSPNDDNSLTAWQKLDCYVSSPRVSDLTHLSLEL